jgi:hypothetical protein
MTRDDPAFPGLDSLAYPSPVFNPGISIRLHVATVLAAAAYGAAVGTFRSPTLVTEEDRKLIARQAVFMADALIDAEGGVA